MLTITLAMLVSSVLYAAEISKAWTPGQYVVFNSASAGDFTVAADGSAAPVIVSDSDWKGVVRAAADLSRDIESVSGSRSVTVHADKAGKGGIIVGTIGRSPLIDKLIRKGKLDVSEIAGQRESFIIQTVGRNLVVAGSDKRGTIYGIYDISEKIGVSPWYWWADVPAQEHGTLIIKSGRYVQHSPKVRYRGIFINDESPSFSGWSDKAFKDEVSANGQNSLMYAHMFELILRLKANYLWPAMWGKAFNEDDPRSPALADEYGVIMGTSHHEPMMRAQKEYTSRQKEVGIWDYVTNSENLKKFWREGLDRNKGYENLVTIGMRGDGDVPMGQGNDEQNTQVLYDVIRDQRQIISDVYGCDASEVPQMWALFTEVQRYYESGMTSPDDVLLMFCDNNWGYIRRTGPEKEQDRKGGLGMYYHIDMNGGPWNDRWVNTTTIPKLREQLSLAYRTGIDDLWIINVGDLKPKELPIDFIMHYAWDPDTIGPDDTYAYLQSWASQNFGDDLASEVAWIMSKYPKYNLMRKAEVQNTAVFSYGNYGEIDRQWALWQELEDRTEALKARVPERLSDAFYELVYYPAVASAGVAKMWLASELNNIYALQNNPKANEMADLALGLFEKDKELSDYYNDRLAGGKWKNMMSDIHIGYVMWSMPRANTLPTLYRVKPLSGAVLGVNMEGSEYAWPLVESQTETVAGTGLRREYTRTAAEAGTKAYLPVFDALNDQTREVRVFNRGTGNLSYTARTDSPWIRIDKDHGTVTGPSEDVIKVRIDWSKLPVGTSVSTLTIRQDGGESVQVGIQAVNCARPSARRPYYGAAAGEYSIDVLNPSENVAGTSAAVAGPKVAWTLLPDLGRGEGCMGIIPNNAPSFDKDVTKAPHLDYDIYIPEAGDQTFCLGILPTQDVNPSRGLRIAVSIDGAAPVVIDAREGLHDEFSEYTQENLARSKVLKALPENHHYTLKDGKGLYRSEVFDNLRWLYTQLPVATSGIHTLKVWMVDPEIVLEKIVVNPDGRYSYSGPVPVLHK